MKRLLSVVSFTCLLLSVKAQDCSTPHDCYNMGHQFGFTEEAIKFYDKAFDLWTGNDKLETKYWILSARGNCYFQMKQYPKAIQNYNQIIQLKPEDQVELAEAYMSRGNVMLASKNFNGAIASYDKAIEINPPNLGATNNKAQAYHRMGDKEKALITLKTCANLGSMTAIADIYIRYENLDYREEMNAALAKDRDWQEIKQMESQAANLVKQKQYPEALDLYDKIEMRYARRGDTENPVNAMVQQAYIERQRGNFSDAIQHASRAVYSSYATKDAFVELAYAKYYSGDQVGGVQACQQGLERYKDNKYIKDVLSFLYANSANQFYGQGDYKTAYDLYYSAYYYDNTNTEAIKYAGHAAYNAQMNKEALTCYNLAVQANPGLRSELTQYIDYLNSVVR